MRTFPKEQIIDAYQNSPKLVREAFNSEGTIAIIRDIRTRYNLHVDTAGTLGENVGYMLIGLLSPSEFLGNMVLAGIDEQTAKGVLEALNTRIFIPLRDRIKNGDTDEGGSSAPSITYNTPAPNSRAPNREAALPPPALEPKPVAPPIPATSPTPKLPYNLVPEVNEQPQIRTMARDMQLMQQGIHPEMAPLPKANVAMTQQVHAGHATPARSFQTASIPVPLSEPSIRPAPTVAESRPPTQTLNPAPPGPQKPIVPASAPENSTNTDGSYDSDPYREPIQ